jgi:hypothetical protein
MTLLHRDYSGDPWANLTLVALKLAWPDRSERHLDEPCAYFGSIDPDSGDTIIVPLHSGNVVEWVEAMAERAL